MGGNIPGVNGGMLSGVLPPPPGGGVGNLGSKFRPPSEGYINHVLEQEPDRLVPQAEAVTSGLPAYENGPLLKDDDYETKQKKDLANIAIKQMQEPGAKR